MAQALFIDGRNTAYRAIFAARGNDQFAKSHPFVVWLRFARTWLAKFKPDSVHVFWDSPKEQLWRRKILPEYKEGRIQPGDDRDISEELNALETVAVELLPYINVRSYRRECQEADDLIYSACRLVVGQTAVVISSDSDMMQLPWHMPHITCYEPRLNIVKSTPDFNPVYQKALMGDSTDNIEGYRGIGEVKSGHLARDHKLLYEFLQVKGDKEFRRNLALIDLSFNPNRLNNEIYVQGVMASDVSFDKSKLEQFAMQYKVRGLMQEFTNSVLPFKSLSKQSNSVEIEEVVS